MRKVNWGIIGLGTIAANFAEGFKLSENAKLIAIASKDSEKINKFKENYNINQNIDSQDFKYNFSNFIFGTTIKLKGIKILPILNYSTDNLVVIVGLQKEF